MKRLSLYTLAGSLLLALAPVLLPQCGAATNGTETGNPPVLDSQKLYLERSAQGVRVVGAPGAVTPGARVRVTNLSSGESAEGSAAADGSLDVSISGEVGDEYELSASNGGQEVTQHLSFPEIALRSDLSTLSCQALEDTLFESLYATFENADHSCTADADCQEYGWGIGASCYYECGTELLSADGMAAAQAAAQTLTEPVCARLADCTRPAPSSCGGGQPFRVISCREGRCQADEPSTLSCDGLYDAVPIQLARIEADADRTCSIDADCSVELAGASCRDRCGGRYVAVASTAAARFRDAVTDQVENNLCGLFTANACDEPSGPCPPSSSLPLSAVCNAGVCEIGNRL